MSGQESAERPPVSIRADGRMSRGSRRVSSKGLFAGLCMLVCVLIVQGCRTADSAKPRPGPKDTWTYTCYRSTGPIVIDGRLDDQAWQNAESLWRFQKHGAAKTDGESDKNSGGTAVSQTTVRMLWDDQYLYVAAEMDDRDLYASAVEHDGPAWKSDVFELFIKPLAQSYRYYEFEITPANVSMDAAFPRRGARALSDALTFESGLESAVTMVGTLNDARDEDIGWLVEMRIPLAALTTAPSQKPVPGMEWRFAACRYDYSVHLPPYYPSGVETSSSARGLRGSFHYYERYDRLVFQ